ncbi:hypothetical protein BH23BAC1_BH23BAC1_43420 [soil metagenome]
MNSKLENFLTKKVRPLAGNFSYNPSKVALSEGAKEIVDQAFDIPGNKLFDYHCHLVSIGTDNNFGYVNYKMYNPLFVPLKLRFNMFASAAGITSAAVTDQQYIDGLVKLLKLILDLGKVSLLALDQYYDKMGRPHPEITRLYVPNDYLMRICNKYPEYFEPVISVHPYRSDALQELEKWGEQGIKFVKWLGNSMNIDASDPLCEKFYQKMKEYNMTLLAHAGNEEAITVPAHQYLGNPLLYRKPLEMGLKVILAHCAGHGMNLDHDSKIKKPIKNYKLFYRMMDNPKYEGLLFGDIAAVTQINRCGSPLKNIIERSEHHHRLINGSDYPLPGVNAANSTIVLRLLGYINKEEKKYLDELYYYNPLLCDFVTKRTIRLPKEKNKKLAPGIFGQNKILPKFNRGQEPLKSSRKSPEINLNKSTSK